MVSLVVVVYTMPEPWPTSELSRARPSSISANCTANSSPTVASPPLVPTATSLVPAATPTPLVPAATSPVFPTFAPTPLVSAASSTSGFPAASSSPLVPTATSLGFPAASSTPVLPVATSPGFPAASSTPLIPAANSTPGLPAVTSAAGVVASFVPVSPADPAPPVQPVSVHVPSSTPCLESSASSVPVSSGSSRIRPFPSTGVSLTVSSAVEPAPRLNGSGEYSVLDKDRQDSPEAAVLAGGAPTAANSMGFQITSVTQSHVEHLDESGDEDGTVDTVDISVVIQAPDGAEEPGAGQQESSQGLAEPGEPVAESCCEDPEPVLMRAKRLVGRTDQDAGDEVPPMEEQLPVIPTTDGFGITLVAGPRLSDLRCSAEMVVDFPADIEMDVTASGLTVASTSAVQEPVETWQSRFKVVKIETNVPFRRGRWQCMDYMDQPDDPEVPAAASTTEPPSAAVPEAAELPLSCQRDLPGPSTGEEGSGQPSQLTSPMEESRVPPSDPLAEVSSTAALQSGVDQAFSAAATAVSSDSGYSGTGGTSSGVPVETGKAEPIDNKIEQAMDLVKSHLLLAVREEVDVLKTTIGRLMDRISSLERENDILRGSVSADILQQLETAAPASAAASSPAASQPLPAVSSSSIFPPSSSSPGGSTL